MTAEEARGGAAPAPADLPKLAVAAILLLLAWTSVMLPGFVFPYSNNIFHVPIVLDYAASAEGPHDAFTNSLDGFVTGVWPALGLVTTERNIFSVFFLAHFASRLLFVAGFYGLIRHFSAPRAMALALAGLAALGPIFKIESPVGRNDTLLFYFTHTELAMAMLPGCWWLLVRGRWIAGAAAIGLMFNVNAFLSIWSVVAALAAIVWVRPEVDRFWRTLLLSGAALAVTALPTAIWTLGTISEPSQPIDFPAYLRSYYPFHTFIDVQWDRGMRYAAYLIAAGLAVRVALAQLGGIGAKILAALLATFAAIFLLGLPLPYLTDWQLLLNLYPLRIDSVVNLLVAAILLAWAGRSLRQAADRDTLPLALALTLLVGNMVAALLLLHLRSLRIGDRRERALVTSATVAAIALLFSIGALPELGKNFIPLILLFCGLALCAAFGRRESEREVPWIATVTAALVCSVLPEAPGYPWPLVTLAIAVASLFLLPRLASLTGFASAAFTCWWVLGSGDAVALLAAAAILALGLALALPRPLWIGRLAELSLSPHLLLALIGAIGLLLGAYAGWRGTVERPDMDLGPEREAQLWVRSHVPPNTELLTVGAEGFGLLARRPIWVDPKAGAAVMWEPDYLPEWRSRMDEVEGCGAAACYAALARRHGLGWLVVAKGRLADPAAAGLDLRFSNPMYEIYSVQTAPAATATGG